jgi:histidinol-phosphate aminotransferase
MYRIHTLASGGQPILVPEIGETTDINAILGAVTDKTRIVFLANPNNPTGTYIGAQDMARLVDGLPPDVLLVIDAAYAEYADASDYEPGLRLAQAHENVVMTRTFSKVYGLASLRVGWLYGPDHIVDAVNRIRGPFNMNGPALDAAVAAVLDQGYVAEQVRYNAKWRQLICDAFQQMGLGYTPSQGNFVLIHFANEDLANGADAYLKKRGYILRPVKPYNLPNALRMTIGPEDANLGVIDALRAFVTAQAA